MAKRKPPKKPTPKPDELPMVLYVAKLKGDHAAPVLVAEDSFTRADTAFEEGDTVGIYHLYQTRKMHVTRGLR